MSTIKTICPALVSCLLRKLRREDSSGVSGQHGPQNETPSLERKRRNGERWLIPRFRPTRAPFHSNTPKIILSYPFTYERSHLYRMAQDLPIFLDKETWIKRSSCVRNWSPRRLRNEPGLTMKQHYHSKNASKSFGSQLLLQVQCKERWSVAWGGGGGGGAIGHTATTEARARVFFKEYSTCSRFPSSPPEAPTC